MAISSYILESLRQHGKADVGPLGIFTLDYKPAKWNISKKMFEIPVSTIHWRPNEVDQVTNLNSIAQVISGLHDIQFSKAYHFIQSEIDRCTIKGEKRISLGVLGELSKQEQEICFSKFELNKSFEHDLKTSPLHLYKLPSNSEDSFNWWWLLISFILLSSLFILIGLFTHTSGSNPVAGSIENKIPELSSTTIKQTNTSPSLNAEKILLDTGSAESKSVEIIIITGSFCSIKNLKNARKALSNSGYSIYEEKVSAHCSRIGIKIISKENPELVLQKIRNTIEPSAWILDKDL